MPATYHQPIPATCVGCAEQVTDYDPDTLVVSWLRDGAIVQVLCEPCARAVEAELS